MKDTRLAKIACPAVTGALQRKALFDKLDDGRQNPLVWLSAPGGAGKTTLVSSYLAARRLPVLWYQVDAGDNDPATFFYYLRQAAKKAAPRRKDLPPLLSAEYLRGLPEFSRNFFSKLFACLKIPSVVVLDNLQAVSESAVIHQCLIDGTTRIPEGVTLILISRSVPPAAYSRFTANGTMAQLDWRDLRLTFAEFEEIVAHWGGEPTPSAVLQTLYARMDGWAAGLQLLLRNSDLDTLSEGAAWLDAPDEVFSYFAVELFGNVEAEVQDCLLRTAFISKITLAAAESLSGNARARAILRKLADQNYFTTRRQGSVAIYEYHPLFQRFLQETARKQLTPEELVRQKRLSAQALLAESRNEEAIALLADAEDWSGVAEQILRNAPGLQAQGRFKTLLEWLSLLPDDRVASSPWLLYWKAVGLKSVDIYASRACYQEAFEGFRLEQDPGGVYTAWAGVVETFLFLWGNFRLLDPWLEVFPRIREEYPDFPDAEVEARVSYAIFSALLWRRSNSPEMPLWAERVAQLVHRTQNPTLKILCGSNLLKYYLWCCGDLARADELILVLHRIDSKVVTPLAALLSKVMLATYYWFRNEMDACLENVEQGLAIGAETGIHLMDTALYAHAVYALLMTGEQQAAEDYLRKMGQLTDDRSHLDVAHYHYLHVWLKLEQGKSGAALDRARIVIDRIEAAGTRQARGFGRYTLGVALCEMGEHAAAQVAFDKGREYGQSMGNGYFEAVYHFCMALNAYRQHDRQQTLESLAQALTIARSKDYPLIPWIGWYRSAFAELLQLALEQRIEEAYVARYVRAHHLVPSHPPIHLETWPWPVKIITLGRFEVFCQGEPLAPAGKTPQRPLALLKVLVAMGGSRVAETQLSDALWPDADGDAARQALKTTIHRLRKLLKTPEAIRYKDNVVSLDRRFCWLDTWAFDALVPKTQTESLTLDQLAAVRQGLDLYRGRFLVHEPFIPEFVSARERWNSRFLHGTEKLGGFLENNGQVENAIELYLRGLDVDPHIELFYQRLMLCYAQLGRVAAALAAYDRCRKTLQSTLGISPSPQTETIRKQFLS